MIEPDREGFLSPMFHLAQGLYFERVEGKVRIVKTRDGQLPHEMDYVQGLPSNIQFTILVTDSGWASVVAALSQSGDTSEKHTAALAFHNT